MILSEIKSALKTIDSVTFRLPNGTIIPKHFHVTEVGKISKHFIDCGGTERFEESISFQLWTANDYDHRLSAIKLQKIIELSEQKLHLKDLPIEVEYQGTTIGKYGLEFNGTEFMLTKKQTDCLAKDNCGIPTEKPRIKLSELQTQSCCDSSTGCC